jgi:carboxypeptidase C (cathepsin A)
MCGEFDSESVSKDSRGNDISAEVEKCLNTLDKINDKFEAKIEKSGVSCKNDFDLRSGLEKYGWNKP